MERAELDLSFLMARCRQKIHMPAFGDPEAKFVIRTWGMFASENIKAKENITFYDGYLMTRDEARLARENYYTNPEWVQQVREGKVVFPLQNFRSVSGSIWLIDGYSINTIQKGNGAASVAKDKEHGANCEFITRNVNNVLIPIVLLRAKKNILAGEEITVSFGYHFDR
jgi:SET domain-containing protein